MSSLTFSTGVTERQSMGWSLLKCQLILCLDLPLIEDRCALTLWFSCLVVWPTYCLQHSVHCIKYTTRLVWHVMGAPCGLTGNIRLLTLYFTKLLLWHSLLQRPQFTLNQGFTNFLFGKRVKGYTLNCLNVGGGGGGGGGCTHRIYWVLRSLALPRTW